MKKLFLFFIVYVPFSMVDRMQNKIDAQQITNELLTTELATLNRKVEFLNLSYEKKQALSKSTQDYSLDF